MGAWEEKVVIYGCGLYVTERIESIFYKNIRVQKRLAIQNIRKYGEPSFELRYKDRGESDFVKK